MLVNNTPYAAATAILMDAAGRETMVVALKAAFGWHRDHSLTLLPEAPAVVTADVYGGSPDTSGLTWANELTLPKPRVDVVLSGEIVLAAAVDQIDCTLTVAGRLSKTVRVFGDRHWRPSAVSSVVPSGGKPFIRMPIAWERSFGGQDPDDAGSVDLRNPVGRGVRKRVSDLEGKPAPNFEDPRAPIKDPLKRPVPVGFGPVAPHWQPRSGFAGTYDQAWAEARFPILPVDFNARFLNAAPMDQQIETYEPGIEVRLDNLTRAGADRFVLPELAPPVTVVDGRTLVELPTVVDTIVIEPAEARVSIVARAMYAPADVQALKAAYVGALTPGQRRALHAGKPYLRLGA